jgi:hypothetical protein
MFSWRTAQKTASSIFLLEDDRQSFEKLAAIEGLRRLRVFDEAPPAIRVQWKCRRSNLRDMVWWASEGGGDLDFWANL